MPEDEIVRINRLYYPGWNVYVDGLRTKIDFNNKYGLMDIALGEGVHSVKAVFSETPLAYLAILSRYLV